MKTRRFYQTKVHYGDKCDLGHELSEEERLIEYRRRLMIEDNPQRIVEEEVIEEEPVAAAAAPVEETGGSSGWLSWCLAGLVCLILIAGGCYYAFHGRDAATNGSNMAYVTSTKGASASINGKTAAAAGLNGITVTANAAQGKAEDYIYYFSNDKSAVKNNRMLNDLAVKAENSDADIVITAYASTVGNAAYNKKLSQKRADNVASYLVAHGVDKDHIKVVSNGATTNYGDDAHNRRANIHVVYPS